MEVAESWERMTKLQSELRHSAAEAEKRSTEMRTLEDERNSLNDKLKAVTDEVNV